MYNESCIVCSSNFQGWASHSQVSGHPAHDFESFPSGVIQLLPPVKPAALGDDPTIDSDDILVYLSYRVFTGKARGGGPCQCLS